MTGEAWFYQLEHSSLEEVLPDLLQKCLAKGWRALVCGRDRSRLAALDDWLWKFSQESFLAHGVDGEPLAERQPILLTSSGENSNDSKVLVLIDDSRGPDVAKFERCILIFDGADDAALASARSRWQMLKAGGVEVTYWRQKANRGWEKQA